MVKIPGGKGCMLNAITEFRELLMNRIGSDPKLKTFDKFNTRFQIVFYSLRDLVKGILIFGCVKFKDKIPEHQTQWPLLQNLLIIIIYNTQ